MLFTPFSSYRTFFAIYSFFAGRIGDGKGAAPNYNDLYKKYV